MHMVWHSVCMFASHFWFGCRPSSSFRLLTIFGHFDDALEQQCPTTIEQDNTIIDNDLVKIAHTNRQARTQAQWINDNRNHAHKYIYAIPLFEDQIQKLWNAIDLDAMYVCACASVESC